MTLGSLLRRHRVGIGLTQEELAERAQVSARTISDVERGLRRRVYRDTAGRLADALALQGVTRDLFEQAARGRGPKEEPRRVPLPPTPLVGRERELAAVLDALGREDVRLLSLTGPGGIGKTRIALEAAARHEDVVFVDLAEVSTAGVVLSAIGRAMGMSATRGATPAVLADHVAGRPVLLVLDTFEHVVEAAADVSAFLGAAQSVKVIVTSRERLRVRGEHEVVVPALDADASAKLFDDRGRAAGVDLPHDLFAEPLVAEIVEKLGGVPLAIELAAARLRHLTLPQLRDQLRRGMHVLTGGARDMPPRQRTMSDAIAWSYGLLDDGEQLLLRELATFAGGWTIEAAEAVCSGKDVLQRMSSLVDKSLVQLARTHAPRYTMLDVIRQYASEQGVEPDSTRRHGQYHLSLAHSAEQHLGGDGQEDWLRRVAAESPNLRLAIRHALGAGDVEAALAIVGQVWRYWLLLGDLSEARLWLKRALDADPKVAPRARAKALWGYSWLSYHQGDYAAMEAAAREALSLAEATADPVEHRNAYTVQGILDHARGRYADALVQFSRAAALLRGRRDWLAATSLLNLGMALIHAEEDGAARTIAQARSMYVSLGDQHYVARSDLYAAYAAITDGRLDRASASLHASLLVFWELDDSWGVAEALEGLSMLAAVEGDADRAAWIAGAASTARDAISARALAPDQAMVQRHLDRARCSVGSARWAAQWTAGRTAGTERAAEVILSSRSMT